MKENIDLYYFSFLLQKRKIQINKEDAEKAWNIILKQNTDFTCSMDNTYFIYNYIIEILDKEGIKFKIL